MVLVVNTAQNKGNKNIFERNPKGTIVIFIIALFTIVELC